jgi:hypothetical protein
VLNDESKVSIFANFDCRPVVKLINETRIHEIKGRNPQIHGEVIGLNSKKHCQRVTLQYNMMLSNLSFKVGLTASKAPNASPTLES